MKRILLAVLVLLILASGVPAQQGNTTTVVFPGVPSGSCGLFTYFINGSNGDFYDCPAGTPVKVGSSSSSGGTITSCATSDAMPYYSAATTLTCDSLILSNTAGGLTAKSLSTGTGCTPAGATATGGVCMTDAASTGWTPTAGFSYIRADTTANGFVCSQNGAAEAACAGGSAWSVITAGANAATGAFSTTAPWTFSVAGAASTPAINITGTPFVGSGTTSTPQLYLNGGTAPTTWSTGTGGTYFGINTITGFTGNFIDFHLNGGTSLFSVSNNGSATGGAGSTFQSNTAQTNNIRNQNTGRLMFTSTAPSVAAAGCGGSAAAISTNGGTAAFKVNVGTSNTGTCTITMPAAAQDWICYATDITTTSTTVSQTKAKPGGTPTTQVTLQNYTDVSGTAAWTDSDVIAVGCWAE